MKWTNIDVKKSIDLLKDKKSYDEIANELNRSYGSVRTKLQRLGYKTSDEQKETKKCLNCNSIIETTISDKQKFCCSSCSVTYNNKLRTIKNNCLNCNCEINSWNKYCSKKCSADHKKNIIFDSIEKGDKTLSEKQYKDYLISKYGNKCMECGWCEIHSITGNVPIQLEHIDGNSDNNSLSNLKLLCPNHHSLTSTYGALNKGNGRDSKRNIKRKEIRNK